MLSFREIVDESLPLVRVVDVGAAEFRRDPYASLSEQGLCEVVGFETMPPEKLLKLAIVLHEVCQSWDLAALALLHYDQLTGKELWLNYIACVSGELQSTPS